MVKLPNTAGSRGRITILARQASVALPGRSRATKTCAFSLFQLQLSLLTFLRSVYFIHFV